MNKRIAYKNLPPRIPLHLTIIIWLLLDRLSAPGWVWGVAATFLTVSWAVCLIVIFTESREDIFKDDSNAA